MAYSYIEYEGDGGTTNFAIPFPYLSEDHVKCAVDGVDTEFTWINESTIQISPAPADEAYIKIYRETAHGVRLVDYNVPGTLTEEDLDNDSKQAFYMAQEAIDTARAAMVPSLETGHWDAQGKRITNVGRAEDADDLVSKADLDEAALSPVTPHAANIVSVPEGGLAATNVQDALNELQDLKAPKASPAFTGTPTAPTPAGGDSSTKVATTAFVQDAVNGALRVVRVYTGSTTWPKPANLKRVRVTVVAGGGAGGGVTTTEAGVRRGAGGGGAGGIAIKVIEAEALLATESVVVGTGGTGVTAAPGNDGGSSSFGAHCSATGGKGGNNAIGNAVTTGGDGGVGSGGDLNLAGDNGGIGCGDANADARCWGGRGGSPSPYGSGAKEVTAGNNGAAGSGYGAGGSGACNGESSATERAGGNGTAGVVIVEEYF